MNRYALVHLLGIGALGLTAGWRGDLALALLALTAAVSIPAQRVLASAERQGLLASGVYIVCLAALAGYAAFLGADTASRLLAAALIGGVALGREAALAPGRGDD